LWEWKINQIKKVFALAGESPEFKPKGHQKKKKSFFKNRVLLCSPG
jgi:hypothetical protein